MSLRIWLSASVLAVVTLFGVPAQAVELPVTTSLSGDSYAVTFAWDDADLSFTVKTNGLTAFTTGGGWIEGLAGPGTHANFGFVAEGTSGHLALVDHSTGQRITGTVLNSFTECVSGVSQFVGIDESGNAFQVNVADNGEPGSGRDFFAISSVSYSNSGLLLGGDVQVHGLCP